MQKRVVYNFNAQTATECAAENSTDKAVKTSNATGKIKRAFSGKSFKLVVLIVLLFASLFCTICSADWMISQQKVVPNVAGNSIFKFDDLGFGAHVNNGKPTGNYTFNGHSISISMSAAAVGGVQNLPGSAIDAQNIRYRVKNCAPDTKPENLSEEFFNSDYTTDLPKDAGTYAVLITSEVTSEAGRVSYGKTIKVFTIAPCPVKIEWSGAVDFTYDGTDHRSNITATAKTENGAVNVKISFSYKAHGATTVTPVTEVKNAGTYTATAEISNDNYTISSNAAATFTIEQRQVTVSDWGNTSFTYNGKAQKPEPSFNNVVNGDNLNATVSIDGNQPINKGVYTAKVTISNDNYKLSGSPSTPFTISPLKIAFDGIIECDYADGGIALNAELFKGKFKIDETIADASSVDLSTVHNDIIGGTAKNFSNNEDTSKPENGFYSYAFGKNITAGSTYLISNITLDSTSNFELTTKSVYLKYKTAKIGDVYYTIEDALAQSGTITLCGDATSDSSYVITAFARFNNLSGTGFENYKSDYKYTLSGKTLIIPFEDSLKEKNCLNKINATYGNVYSALVIQNNISITLSNSASITVGAELSYNQRISCALAERHGVLSNNGTITAESGCKVSAYGYIKGTGKIILKSGAIGNDVVSIYDFPGGAVILYNMSKIFPTNAFTLHSNACETYIYSGAKYKGFTYFVLDTPIIGNTGYEATAEIVGANSKSGLFAPTSESGYIIKKVKALSGYDINDISVTNQRISSNTKLQHRDNIEVYGAYKDNTMELSVSAYKFQTSTDKPFPIGLMDITIKTGNLTLEKSSYMVMPGSTIKVENGAKLIVNGKSKLSAIKYDTINSATGNQKYTNYFSTTSDGEIVVNGELTTASTAQVGGKILTTETAASIQLSNSSASYIMLIHTDKSNATLSGTINAFGNIMTSPSSYAQRDLSAGTYYSTKIGSDYVWFKNSATITCYTNDGTSENTTQNITLPSGGYISSNLPEPTRLYYEFNGWYYDKALTQKATTIFASCDLYAKWSEKEYTIIFNIPDGFGKFGPIKLYGEHTYNLPTLDTVTKDGQTYYFNNWYLYADYSGTAIKQVSAKNANGQNIINVYAFYSGGTYTVKYNENPENLKFANNLKVDKPENQTFDKGKAVSQSELKSLNRYNENPSFDYYFAGWYLSTDSETIITSLPSTINGDITLCAKWIKKHIVTINFTSNDSILETENRLGTIVKYYKDGEVNLQNLYNDNSIAAKIDEYYAPHGNIKEYTLIEWQENGTVITTNVVNVTRNFDITAYHKRCYYITVQKLNATVNGITGGLGTFYASPLDTTFATAITCTLIANKERYTPEYSAINASVDANGVISFANSNSAETVIINITTQRWFMIDNQYTKNITLKVKSSTGIQDGNWFTENATVTVTLKGAFLGDEATIQKYDGTAQYLKSDWSSKSTDITISGWYIIKKA